MINALDLPAVREQIEAATNLAKAAPEMEKPEEPSAEVDQLSTRPRPVLSLDNGRYYVVDSEK